MKEGNGGERDKERIKEGGKREGMNNSKEEL